MKFREFVRVIFRGEANISLMKKQGLKIGDNFSCQRGVIIDKSHCFLIEIGNNVTLAPRVHILAHDASTKKILGYTKIGKVKIGDNVFIGAGAIILPGVKIGDNCIIGAGSIVTKSIPENSVVCGNPAVVIKSMDEYKNKELKIFNKSHKYDENYIINKISEENKKNMLSELEDQVGYII